MTTTSWGKEGFYYLFIRNNKSTLCWTTYNMAIYAIPYCFNNLQNDAIHLFESLLRVDLSEAVGKVNPMYSIRYCLQFLNRHFKGMQRSDPQATAFICNAYVWRHTLLLAICKEDESKPSWFWNATCTRALRTNSSHCEFFFVCFLGTTRTVYRLRVVDLLRPRNGSQSHAFPQQIYLS